MTRLLRVLALVTACSTACSRSSDTPPVEGDSPPLTTTPSVTEKGIGDMVAGMTVPHAEAILKTSLAPPAGTDSAACRMARWDGAPPGVSLMFEGGNFVRVDVDSGPITTTAGVKVGDPEAKVTHAYAGRVQTTPHKYETGGHYLTVVPASPADSGFRVVFETDGKVVTRYRAGIRPQVDYVERCG
jgi:hypothetical protein